MYVEGDELPVATSSGNRTMTASQLNMSWMVAAAKARRNSRRSEAWPRDTTVLVTDVPMLAPITIGMASRTRSTVMKKT